MLSTKRKVAIVVTIVVATFAIMAVIYALATGTIDFLGKTTTGSVEIENINLSFTKSNGSNAEIIEPSDYNTISWTTKNIGTSGIRTRYTLEIIWNDFNDNHANYLLSLFPANVPMEDAIADLDGIDPMYRLDVEDTTKEINGNTRCGIKCQFTGDVLDGTDMSGVSQEVNYNSGDFETTTDDENFMEDNVALKLLISPKLSYLYQNKSLSIFVTTEAMQYTEDGNQEWSVVDSKQIN